MCYVVCCVISFSCHEFLFHAITFSFVIAFFVCCILGVAMSLRAFAACVTMELFPNPVYSAAKRMPRYRNDTFSERPEREDSHTHISGVASLLFLLQSSQARRRFRYLTSRRGDRGGG